MIHELLSEGSENARTSKELAEILGCDRRTITKQIEKERHAGQPICANTLDEQGYYMAKNADELQRYCRRLQRREGRIGTTRRKLLKTLRVMIAAEKAAEGAGNGKQEDRQR